MDDNSAQKIIIPKGLINPSETTIIEIPQHLKRIPVIIAQKQTRWSQEPQYVGERYPKNKYLSTRK